MGFFSNTQSTNPQCGSCGLFKKAKNPQMGVFGKGNRNVLILTKCPSSKQDAEGNLLVGEATNLLATELKKQGLDLFEDCFVVSALGCKTHRNTERSKKDAKKCLPRINTIINKIKPQMIICIGAVALHQIAGQRMSDVSIDTYQGHCYPDYKYNCWIGTLPHPSSLLQEDDYGNTLYNDKYYMKYFTMMIDEVLGYIDKPLPAYHDVFNKVELLTAFDDVYNFLVKLNTLKIDFASYDYETSTANCNLPKIKVATIAISYDGKKAYSFALDRKGVYTREQYKKIKKLWIKFLKREDILKVCHNISLEYNFDVNYFGVRVPNYQDTMPFVHQINTTPGTKGLKYQLSIRFGIESYDDEIEHYLKPPSIIEYNEIDKAPLNKLLIYNGIDALGGYWLYQEIRRIFKYGSKRKSKWRDCADLYQKGIVAFCDSHRRGIDLDLDFLREEEKRLQIQRDGYIKKIHESKEGKLYKERTGKDLEITNNNEIGKLIYEFLEIEPKRKTPTGQGQTTKEALEELNLGFVNDLLQAKKIEKHCNDFVTKLIHTNIDGRVYPEIGVSHARSGRPNCFGWNIMQIPKRDPIGKRVRMGYVAPKDYYVVSRDFGSIEVTTNQSCSNDPVLRDYLLKGADPHHDNAKLAYIMTDEQVTKPIRQFTKQSWTFLLFYRGYPTSSAKRIMDNWEHLTTGDGFTLKEHYAIHGIDDFFKLKDHCIEKADEMWERFAVFHEYQSNKENEYFKKGYIENPMGFRRGNWVTPNQSINSPAQGLGFQWLMDAYIYLTDWFQQNNMKSYLWANIYDDILHMVHKDELQEVLEHGYWAMTKRLEEKYDHIQVPLQVDTEVSDLGGSWYSVAPWERGEDGIWEPKNKEK